jgi:glycosyltransferase involved in cell wall biosynthesis/CTP:molybdopterin cytidylyltransferase MocA
MARALADAGHELHVLTARHPGLPGHLDAAPGVQLHGVDPPGASARFLGPDPVRHAVQVHETLRRMDAERPFDVIEFPEYDGEGQVCLEARRTLGAFPRTVLAVRLHTPSVDVRTLDGDPRLSLDLACIDFLEGSSIEWADLVLSPTEAMLARVRARQLVPRAALSPHPIDPDFTPAPDTGSRELEILHVGRLERRKGVELLLRAAFPLLEQRPGLTLRFVGGDTPTGPTLGSMRAHLQRLVPAALEGRVRFEPPRDRAALLPLLRAATLCCFPSLWENFPNTCLEAMAAGVGVVAADGSGMAEMIEDGRSGLLFRTGDVEALRRTLARALDEPGLRQTLRDGAPERVRALCAPPVVAARFAEVVRSAAPVPPVVRGGRPSVAVIVPSFELGALLDETLASVRAQTRPADEVIVVDDGSSGAETLAALERAERAGTRVLRQKNQGLGAARNAGVRASRSELVVPLDADDLLAPTFLEQTVDAWLRAGERTVVTSLVSWFQADPAEPVGAWFPWGAERDALAVRNVASTATALVPRAILDELGGYDAEMDAYEDWDLWCRAVLAGVEFRVVPGFLFHYRQRPGSMMKVHGRAGRERLVARMLERYPELPREPDRALRLLLHEAANASEVLRQREEDPPLRHRLVDGANAALKRIPGLHALTKRLFRGSG